MASRRFKQFQYSLETAVVKLYGKVTFGATGAPTLAALTPATNQGIASIVRNSAGKYTITLTDPYVRVMNVSRCAVLSSGLPASPDMNLVSDSVSTAAAPALVIEFSVGGVATDPASGEAVLLEITLKNSSIQ